ncbi:uL15 family ribosomal protein [Candidatus Woesearchaeota archaeon]|nr:uL15 family ribosomal protein [Candidatus Woesearchaeota archaeon]
MTVNKRKKFSRYRASMTHGKGSKKKRRGSGNLGGAGMSGSGKRADSKKPSNWKEKRYFGKYGFISKSKKNIVPVNISYIDANLNKLPMDTIKKENSFYSIDLSKLGFNKLLSGGKEANKYKIKVQYASKKAIEKVKGSGGEVILPEQKV